MTELKGDILNINFKILHKEQREIINIIGEKQFLIEILINYFIQGYGNKYEKKLIIK